MSVPPLTGHEPWCEAVRDRALLEAELATDPANPYLLGAHVEYGPNGDQTADLCDCGAWDRTHGLPDEGQDFAGAFDGHTVTSDADPGL